MTNQHLVNHHKHSCLKSDNTLHVIGIVQNSVRWHSRLRLFRQWAKEMVNTPNVKLYVVEVLHGDRKQECVPEGPADYTYMAVKTSSEIWLKENALNIGIKHLLPTDWKYLCWADTDIHFRNHNWAQESIHQLQHYQIIQPWKDALDLAHDGGVMQHFTSFGYYSAKDMPCAASVHNPYKRPYGHSGFVWCCTRYFYENVEKLLDFAILGAGDAHMAQACHGKVQDTINQQMSDGYKHMANLWQAKALYACGGLVGYTPGRIEHHFHGAKPNRRYGSRWQILVKYKFDPLKDLRYDRQGVLHLKGKKKLEHAIMRYNRQRLEDDLR